MTRRTMTTWWEHAVVVQVYVRSFSDSNGDGIGDLPGITARLDHLADLGADAIWLTPCYPSPQRDHGYDVADYFAIEPDYGTLADFDRLVAAARERGLRVLMDVVPNHCSDQHPWFRAAVAAGRGAPERERFFFRDGLGVGGAEPPNNWPSWFGGSAWTRVVEPDGSPGQWYLHTFTPEQPDWNWSNDDVRTMFDDALTFWFDRGVDGFRCDAVIVVAKADGLPAMPPLPPEVREVDAAGRNPHVLYLAEGHDVWRRWRALTDRYEAEHPGRSLVLVPEAYAAGRPDLLAEYVRPDEFHQAFAFDLLLAPWHAPSLRTAVDDVIDVVLPTGGSVAWTLNNHDAQRCVTRYGRADATSPGDATWNNLISSEAPVDLALGTRRARAAMMLALALPGAAYLYAGEELGLPEVLDLPDDRRQDPIFLRTEGRERGRDGCRVPLPWTEDPTTWCGFSMVEVDEARRAAGPWLPLPEGWAAYAAARQTTDAASVLALYRDAIAARRGIAALRSPTLDWDDSVGDEGTVAFWRGEDRDLLVVVNCSDHEIRVDGSWTLCLSSVHGHDDANVVPSDAAAWLARSPAT